MAIQSAKLVLALGIAAIISADRVLAQTNSTLQTVTVTADKLPEAPGNVLMAVTALAATPLVRHHSTWFWDDVDEAALIETTPVTNQLITSGASVGSSLINCAVPVYIDDTPWTSEGSFVISALPRNLDFCGPQRIDVLYESHGTLYEHLLENRCTGGVADELTSQETLTQSLSSTGLTFKGFASNTVTLVPLPEDFHLGAMEDGSGSEDTGRVGQGGDTSNNVLRSTFPPGQDPPTAADELVNSDAENGSSSPTPRRDDRSNSDADRRLSANLEQVVVTAEKRTELLQDVPVPVTVISAQTLVDSNELRDQDWYTSIPGLSFSSGPHGEPYLAIRGITADYHSNPSVGITIDEVPYGSSTSLGGGYIAPDLDPSDLARIEVLRGPQGTLYGANSIGGLIKYVTVDPSTDGSSGSIQVGSNSVYNGAELGYSARGAVNLPLGDTSAIRASVYTRRDAGYIDDIQSGERGVNERHADGGRLSLLWRPSEAVLLKVGALLQDINQDGLSAVYVGPNFGDLQQDVLRGSGRYDARVQAYSAALAANLGGVNLTAISGYNVQSTSGWYDVTPLYSSYVESVFGLAGATSNDSRRTEKFTQEARLSASIGERVEWLLGGFYTHEDSPGEQSYFAADAATGAVGPSFAEAPFVTTYAEQALFTDLTFRFTDRVDVQVGGRESQIKQTLTESLSGVLIGPTTNTEGHSKADAFTYLITPRFKVSPDLMVYARLASGYRPGGPNTNAALLGVQSQYNPDKTQNYEVGVKGAVLNNALSFDASLYYIEWKDIQLTLVQKGLAYDGNAGAAKSDGVEFTVESRPLAGLAIAAWLTWDDDVLTEPFPSTSLVYGVSGDRLPNSSRVSGHLSLQQDFRVTAQLAGFAGAAVSYVGDRVGTFQATSQRQVFPAYTQANLRAGMLYELWTTTLYVTNVADRRGVLAGGLDAVPTNSFIYIQPRTIGLAISRTF